MQRRRLAYYTLQLNTNNLYTEHTQISTILTSLLICVIKIFYVILLSRFLADADWAVVYEFVNFDKIYQEGSMVGPN